MVNRKCNYEEQQNDNDNYDGDGDDNGDEVRGDTCDEKHPKDLIRFKIYRITLVFFLKQEINSYLLDNKYNKREYCVTDSQPIQNRNNKR